MNRRFPIILVVAIGFAILAGAFLLRTPGPTPDAAPSTSSAAESPAASTVETAPSVEPAPAPAPAPTPRRAEPRPTAPAAAREAAAPTTGELRVATDVPAQVFVDRVFLGAAPATASGLAPGPHQLNVTAEGYDGISRSVDVEPGSHEIEIRFKEVRLDASIDVVHDHRMGSCEGRLIGTPTALTYQTDNRNDAFSVPLSAVGRFEVDYLNKNLAIEVKGKTYNFKDPGGNADNLFVFHRDVDKARARLAAGDAPAQP